MCPFNFTTEYCRKFGARKPVNDTSFMTIDTPTDRPKLVGNSCLSRSNIASVRFIFRKYLSKHGFKTD